MQHKNNNFKQIRLNFKCDSDVLRENYAVVCYVQRTLSFSQHNVTFGSSRLHRRLIPKQVTIIVQCVQKDSSLLTSLANKRVYNQTLIL